MTDVEARLLEAGPRPPRRRRRRWWAVALAIVVVAILGAAVVVVPYLLRERPDAVSVDEAVEQYRASSSTTTPDQPAFRRPAPGVYPALGSGRAEISFPPNSQEDGPIVPASLEWLDDGCWRWRVNYNEARWHEVDLCPVGADLVLVGQRNYLRWDYGTTTLENVAEFRCEPPSPVVDADAVPGTTFEHRCTGTNTAVPGVSTSAGTAVVVGTEVLVIGGVEVPAIRQTQRREMSGGQWGVDQEDWWYAADTGLPLRVERSIDLKTGSPIGDIGYTEQGWWQLAALEPRT